MRKINFSNGEYYHLYNRGTDKRSIIIDEYDVSRFLSSMDQFNTTEPIGSIYEKTFNKEGEDKPIVRFIAYCLNPNHFHFLIEQIEDNGIAKFMQRLGTGYTKYFNNRHKRNGSLFQGSYKAKHIDDNNYLLHLSAYINLNNLGHQLGSEASKLVKSSWDEYISPITNPKICDSNIILDQFKDNKEYEQFAQEALDLILENKEKQQEYQLFD